ncbi:MAG: winged helix-turn-helix transcriptional regulator [Candidatus Eremiobacteraeota bacterium]|nr:winged helix-turn-helix transcriptional regulator [Candidatus Eremiobacteraeota bacterium]
MVNYPPKLDAVYAALSDPTRRRMIEHLARGRRTIGELGAQFQISQPAISRHIKVLERSGLIKRTVSGREHHCNLQPRALHSALTWIERQERFWNASLDRLDTYLKDTQRSERQP